MGGSSFCTMGGMSSAAAASDGASSSSLHSGLQHRGWDGSLPIILPNETKNDDGHADHDQQHRGMDGGDGNAHDHGGGHDMNHDQSSHSHSHSMSMGTAMYMDGFHSALFPPSDQPPPPCLNLFSPAWTLHTQSKFLFATIFVALLGMLVEACGVWRVKCLRRGRGHRREMKMKRLRRWEQRQRDISDREGQRVEFRRESRLPPTMRSAVSDISDVSSNENENEEGPLAPAAANVASTRMCPATIRRMWRKMVPKCIRNVCAKMCCCFQSTKSDAKLARRYELAAATLHASRAALGYLLMLAVMTYAIEFLVSAVAGMVLGRYWFVDRDDGSDNVAGGGVLNGAVGVGGGIGGMGLGEGGRNNSSPGVGMTDMKGDEGNDGTWGAGGDPCCPDDDDDDRVEDGVVEDSFRSGSLQEPLLSPLMANNVGVTRRSGVGLPTE